MNLVNGGMKDLTDSYHVSVRDQSNLERFMERLNASKKKRRNNK